MCGRFQSLGGVAGGCGGSGDKSGLWLHSRELVPKAEDRGAFNTSKSAGVGRNELGRNGVVGDGSIGRLGGLELLQEGRHCSVYKLWIR